MRVKKIAAVVGIALGAAGGTAWAAEAVTSIVAPDGTISGCYQQNNGQLRVVASGEACRSSEVAISWNQKGQQGDAGAAGSVGPTGPQGPAGATGAAGPRGPEGPTGPNGEAGAVGGAGPAGPAGPKGEKGDVGGGVAWRGEWQGGVGSPMYAVGDLVRRNGAIWVARQATGGGCRLIGGVGTCPPAPGTDETVWELFAHDGAEGAAGAQGGPGPQGPQGQKGDTGSTGPQGPAGPQGAAGAAGGVSGYEIVYNEVESSAFFVNGSVTCPAGKRLLGGGAYVSNGGIYESAPDRFSGGTRWVAAGFVNVGGARLYTYGICANAQSRGRSRGRGVWLREARRDQPRPVCDEA